jgi:hypothetical protein
MADETSEVVMTDLLTNTEENMDDITVNEQDTKKDATIQTLYDTIGKEKTIIGIILTTLISKADL